MTYVPDKVTNIEFEVANTGVLNGVAASLISIFGYRSQWASTTAQGDVCAYLVGGQNTMNTPTVGQTLYINSTSAQDATGGTGVDRLRVVYLDASGNEQVGTYNLNGTTAVSIGTGFSFIQWMESYHSTTAERVPAGNLTISSTNGVATEATTFEMIRAGANRSESGRYKVPTGKCAHLVDWHSSAVKQGASQQYEVALRSTQLSNDGPSNTYHLVDSSSLVDGTARDAALHYRKLSEGTVVKVSVVPSSAAAGNVVRCGSDFIIVTC